MCKNTDTTTIFATALPSTTANTRQKICEKWVGVPYVRDGRSTSGVDCTGLLYCIYEEYGYTFPLRSFPRQQSNWLPIILRTLQECFKVRQDRKAQFLDLLLFNVLSASSRIYHCGLYLEADLFIHVMGTRKVRTDSLSQWTPNLVKAMEPRRM
jgi:cell wall-associated NlpC family hydrolase